MYEKLFWVTGDQPQDSEISPARDLRSNTEPRSQLRLSTRINYSLACLPIYFFDILRKQLERVYHWFHSAASSRYRLRSTGSEAYILPRTRTRFGERGFFYSGPAAWNTLLSDFHDITNTSTFRKRLKNVLFDRAFN